MLKISTSSLKSGIKELSKVKAKSSHLNLYSDGNKIYLTKVCLDDLCIDATQIATYELDGEAIHSFNHELQPEVVKALAMIKEHMITIDDPKVATMIVTTDKRSINFPIGSVNKKKEVTAEYEFNRRSVDFIPLEIVTIEGTEMQKILQVTDYAAKDMTRPILRGINFRGNKIAALDGYRLALRECSTMSLKNEYTVNSEALIAISTLVKKDSRVEIAFNEKQSRVTVGKLAIYSFLLEGSYTKYEGMIPSENIVEFTFDKAELKEEVEFINACSDKTKLLKFVAADKKISVASVGLTTADIKLYKAKAKGELTIGFNAEYIADMLKHFDDKIIATGTRETSPMVFKSKDIAGIDLILPVRLF